MRTLVVVKKHSSTRSFHRPMPMATLSSRWSFACQFSCHGGPRMVAHLGFIHSLLLIQFLYVSPTRCAFDNSNYIAIEHRLNEPRPLRCGLTITRNGLATVQKRRQTLATNLPRHGSSTRLFRRSETFSKTYLRSSETIVPRR